MKLKSTKTEHVAKNNGIRNLMVLITYTMIIAACNESGSASGRKLASSESPKQIIDTTAMGTNLDPVCGMSKEPSWIEYALLTTDTVWFCSETCKRAFEGNPRKYSAKKTKNNYQLKRLHSMPR